MDIVDNMTSDFPPTFVWTTKEDTCVDPINSKMLIDSLKINNVKYQFDLFEHGVHGGSLCNRAVYDYRHNLKEYNMNENRIWIQNASDFVFSLIVD